MPDPTPEQIQQGETVVSYYTRLLAARDARIAELEGEVKRLTMLNEKHAKAWREFGGGDA